METDTYITAVLVGQGYISPEALTEPVKRLRQQMDAQYGISLTAGIGTHAAMPADVAESVRNEHIAARYRLVYGPGQRPCLAAGYTCPRRGNAGKRQKSP